MAVYQEKSNTFHIGLKYQPELDAQSLSSDLRQAFESHNIKLSKRVVVVIQEKGGEWLIRDEAHRKAYTVRRVANQLDVAAVKSRRQKIVAGIRLAFGFGIVALLVVMFILSVLGLTPHDPERPKDFWTAKNYQPPFQSTEYLLGTDHLGRDLLSRLIAGVEPYFLPGLTAVLISLGFGVLLGTGAGFYGGWLKNLINFFVSVINSFPRLVLFLLVMAILKIDIWVIMMLLGFFNAPKIAVLIEGKVHALKSTDFIEAARALGLTDTRIIWHHIIRKNCIGLLLVQASYGFADAILVETSLSYLGFGVQEPHASWGNMVLAGKSVFLEGSFWFSSLPAILIMIAILGLHQAGDNLNRILEEK